MIYTVTFNPALDYIVWMDAFAPGAVNRTRSEEVFPGGKGINVAIVLGNLGVQCVALGFIAGFSGDEIKRRVEAVGCRTDFIRLQEGISRINLKMKAKEETEINAVGPHIKAQDIDALFCKLNRLQKDDILVLAGSIPSSLPADIYERIFAHLDGRGVRFVVDATGDLLVNALRYRPFLIKPNNHELGEIFGKDLSAKENVVTYAKKLQEKGAQNVLVSMAGEGAVLVAPAGVVYTLDPPQGPVVNSVGAGDSMVAGFLAGYLESGDLLHAFQLGLCAGSATAFSPWLAQKDEVIHLMKHQNWQ